eukprot:scaffold18352_cov89-Cylindrotheca_fusiformis.AAC.1
MKTTPSLMLLLLVATTMLQVENSSGSGIFRLIEQNARTQSTTRRLQQNPVGSGAMSETACPGNRAIFPLEKSTCRKFLLIDIEQWEFLLCKSMWEFWSCRKDSQYFLQ